MNCPVEFSDGNGDRSAAIMAHALLLSETFSLQPWHIIEIKYLNGSKHHVSRIKWGESNFKHSYERALRTWIIGTFLQLTPPQAVKCRVAVLCVCLGETPWGTKLHASPNLPECYRCMFFPGGRRVREAGAGRRARVHAQRQPQASRECSTPETDAAPI